MSRGNPNPNPATRFTSENQPEGAAKSRKGSRDTLSKAFLADLQEVWAEHGKPILCALAIDPSNAGKIALAKIVGSLLPKEIEISTAESKLTDEQLEEIYQRLLAGIPQPEKAVTDEHPRH